MNSASRNARPMLFSYNCPPQTYMLHLCYLDNDSTSDLKGPVILKHIQSLCSLMKPEMLSTRLVSSTKGMCLNIFQPGDLCYL